MGGNLADGTPSGLSRAGALSGRQTYPMREAIHRETLLAMQAKAPLGGQSDACGAGAGRAGGGVLAARFRTRRLGQGTHEGDDAQARRLPPAAAWMPRTSCYLAALKALALVRKLAVPALQINRRQEEAGERRRTRHRHGRLKDFPGGR